MAYESEREQLLLKKIYTLNPVVWNNIKEATNNGEVMTFDELLKLYEAVRSKWITEKESEKKKTEAKKDDWRVSKDEKFRMMDERWG